MPSIEKITTALLPELYPLLHEFDPGVPQSGWERLFDHGWSSDEEGLGYALVEQGRMVGVLGAIFSERQIAGRAVRFCNMHCWYVQPEYRSGSLLLMRPLLNRKDCTLTDFSAAPVVCDILRRVGFASLDLHAVVMPCWSSRATSVENSECEIAECQQSDAEQFAGADQRIFQDHQSAPCGHMLLRDAGGYCYVVYSRIERHPLPYCLLHYVSDPARFAAHSLAVRRYLAGATSSRFVLVDSRLVSAVRIPQTFRIRAAEKLFRSAGVEPRHVDTLYSEMPLLGLSTLLSRRGRLSVAAKSVLPTSAVSFLRGQLQRRQAPSAQPGSKSA